MTALAFLLVPGSLYVALKSGVWWDIPASVLLDLGASYGPAIASGEGWRLVSAIFLHGGLLHLVFNAFALIEIGRPVAQAQGRWLAATVFILAGASGFMASLLWQPEGISVGASGGIFGLLGVWVCTQWRRASTDAQSPQNRLTLMLAAPLALGLGFLLPNVDHAAHLGGLATGLVFGGLLQIRKWRQVVFFASAGALALGLFLGLLHLPESWRTLHEETRHYTQRYLAFALEDRAITDALQKMGEDSRKNLISDEEGLKRLEQDVLPRLAEQVALWQSRTWQTPRIAEDAARWTRYAALRQEAVLALHQAIADIDPARAQIALSRFESRMSDAARIIHSAHADGKDDNGKGDAVSSSAPR